MSSRRRDFGGEKRRVATPASIWLECLGTRASLPPHWYLINVLTLASWRLLCTFRQGSNGGLALRLFLFFLFRFVSGQPFFLLFSSLPNLKITFFFIPGIWRELAVLRRERRSCSTRLRNGWLWWKVPLRVLWLVGFGSYYCIVLLWVL